MESEAKGTGPDRGVTDVGVRPTVARRRPSRPGRYADEELAHQRDAVVASATLVFLERGVKGASFQAIARAAHVSPKTIYAWFGGKEGLFTAALERMVDELSSGLQEALDLEAPLELALRRFGERLLEITLSPQVLALYRIVSAEALALPDIAAAFEQAGPQRGLDRLVDFLRARGVPQPDRAAEAFVAIVQGRSQRRALLGLDDLALPEERRRRIDYALELLLGAGGASSEAPRGPGAPPGG